MPTDALSVLCAQLTRDLLAIAKFLFYFFVRKMFQPTYWSGRWTHFDTRYIYRRVLTQGIAFWEPEQYFNNFTLKFGHIMESLWEIHIRITAWCIEIRCWNLASCLTLPSTLSTHKSFSVPGTARELVAPTLNFRTPSLSRKLIELGSWNLAHL